MHVAVVQAEALDEVILDPMEQCRAAEFEVEIVTRAHDPRGAFAADAVALRRNRVPPRGAPRLGRIAMLHELEAEMLVTGTSARLTLHSKRALAEFSTP